MDIGPSYQQLNAERMKRWKRIENGGSLSQAEKRGVAMAYIGDPNAYTDKYMRESARESFNHARQQDLVPAVFAAGTEAVSALKKAGVSDLWDVKQFGDATLSVGGKPLKGKRMVTSDGTVILSATGKSNGEEGSGLSKSNQRILVKPRGATQFIEIPPEMTFKGKSKLNGIAGIEFTSKVGEHYFLDEKGKKLIKKGNQFVDEAQYNRMHHLEDPEYQKVQALIGDAQNQLFGAIKGARKELLFDGLSLTNLSPLADPLTSFFTDSGKQVDVYRSHLKALEEISQQMRDGKLTPKEALEKLKETEKESIEKTGEVAEKREVNADEGFLVAEIGALFFGGEVGEITLGPRITEAIGAAENLTKASKLSGIVAKVAPKLTEWSGHIGAELGYIPIVSYADSLEQKQEKGSVDWGKNAARTAIWNIPLYALLAEWAPVAKLGSKFTKIAEKHKTLEVALDVAGAASEGSILGTAVEFLNREILGEKVIADDPSNPVVSGAQNGTPYWLGIDLLSRVPMFQKWHAHVHPH